MFGVASHNIIALKSTYSAVVKFSTQVLEIYKNENEPANIRNEPILLKKHKVGHIPLWILKEHALMSIMAFPCNRCYVLVLHVLVVNLAQ